MPAYYNELDPFAAEWLRNLIQAGHIAPGDVDTRSIVDVKPEDLKGYGQCHFFAGIGGWSLALRLAGWPDDRPVWTGSCPCQPFSSAGKQSGSEDERHLWPAFFGLIRECRPVTVFGEQVASALGRAWLDHVCADLESAGYAAAAANLPACSVGAPHIRQRLWFVADSQRGTAERWGHDLVGTQGGNEGEAWERQRVRVEPGAGIAVIGMADSAPGGLGIDGRASGDTGHAALGDAVGTMADSQSSDRGIPVQQRGSQQEGVEPRGRGEVGSMADSDQIRHNGAGTCGGRRDQPADSGILGDAKHAGLEGLAGDVGNRNEPGRHGANAAGSVATAGESDPWRDIEWLPCRDGKARPTQPGLFPLAHGIPGRVGRLRAYGNAIVAPLAAEVIGAFMEIHHG